MPTLGLHKLESGCGKAMSDSEFVQQMMDKIEEACGPNFTTECIERTRQRDPELDRQLRVLEFRTTNEKETTK